MMRERRRYFDDFSKDDNMTEAYFAESEI